MEMYTAVELWLVRFRSEWSKVRWIRNIVAPLTETHLTLAGFSWVCTCNGMCSRLKLRQIRHNYDLSFGPQLLLIYTWQLNYFYLHIMGWNLPMVHNDRSCWDRVIKIRGMNLLGTHYGSAIFKRLQISRRNPYYWTRLLHGPLQPRFWARLLAFLGRR